MDPMQDKPGWLARFIRESLKVALGVVLGLGLLAGVAYGLPTYMNWSADNKAQAFCAGIKRGADIAPVVANFEKAAGDQRILHYESDDGASHTFLFEGFVYELAACQVTVDKDRKATAGRVAVHQ